MKLKHSIIIFVVFFVFLLAKTSFGSTTSASPISTPASFFVEWQAVADNILLDIFMPYGENGKYLYVKQDGKIVSSTTLRQNTPFAEKASVSIKRPSNGTHDFVAQLCNDVEKKYCAESIPLSLYVNKNNVIREIDLNPDDIGEDRLSILTERDRDEYILKFVSMINRYSEYSKNTNPNNVIRAKQILSKSSLSSIITNIDNLEINDFHDVILNNPRFCGEAKEGESLESACAKDLAAYLTYLLYFTNDEVKHEFVGMKNKTKINSFLDIPNSEIITKESKNKEVLAAVMDWYMSPNSPEIDPHSALLGLYLPNEYDLKNNIKHGFGSTINIASNGEWCTKQNESKRVEISNFYTKLLRKTSFTDTENVSCVSQSPFSTLGAAYYPEFYVLDSKTKTCVLGINQTSKSVYSSDFISDCKVASSTFPYVIPTFVRSGLDDAYLSLNRIKNTPPISSLVNNVDKRVTFGKKISATYNPRRAYEPSTQPSQIPFNKINELVFEGAHLLSTGGIEITDTYAAYEMPFSGDCLRKDCKRGIINQFSSVKKVYPDLNILLQIKIDEDSSLIDTKSIDNFTSSVEKFLTDNSEFDGVQLNLVTSNKKVEGESLKNAILRLRATLSERSESLGKKSVSIAIPADTNSVKTLGLKDIESSLESVYLLAYDNHSKLEKKTFHNAQVFSFNDGVDNIGIANSLIHLKGEGISANRIVIGIPAFGRIYNNVEKGSLKDLPGLFAGHDTKENDTYIDYATMAEYLIGRGAYQYNEDKSRIASYLYDGSTFISYDSPSVVEQKMNYIFKDGYKGVLIADIKGDNGDLTEKILRVISKGEQSLACNMKRVIKTNIKDGDRNADVFALQSYLKCLGYFPTHIDINGYFSMTTKEALEEFQRDNKLIPTGTADEKTRQLLTPKS